MLWEGLIPWLPATTPDPQLWLVILSLSCGVLLLLIVVLFILWDERGAKIDRQAMRIAALKSRLLALGEDVYPSSGLLAEVALSSDWMPTATPTGSTVTQPTARERLTASRWYASGRNSSLVLVGVALGTLASWLLGSTRPTSRR